LGAVLLDERHLDVLTVDCGLKPEHFYLVGLGAVFSAMLALHAADARIDHLTVAEQLREAGQLDAIGGKAAIEELVSWVPVTGMARDYGRIVRDNAQLRDLLSRTVEIQEGVRSRDAPARDLVERAERAMLEVANDERRKAVTPIADAMSAELDQINARDLPGDALTGTPSGFTDLDRITGGFQPGALVVLAARPGMGKSALAINVAENAAFASHTILMFLLEMSEAELR
jgi:replicative DNA helicase